ncbi:MAG: colicin uptake protein, partial [Planctomycetia bacterium]|nr:colicin uptake protein [Planctomycetia bacterium]
MRPVALLILFTIVSNSSAAEPVDYIRDIKPILKDRCYACHGALAQKAELRLDSGKGIHEAVTPGKPNESALLERVREKEESARMPPEGVPLTAEQIAKLKTWIEQGAKYPADDKPEPSPQDHWAFRKPVKSEPPSVTIPAFNPHPVDRFVAAEW